jgi:hypothetical protein
VKTSSKRPSVSINKIIQKNTRKRAQNRARLDNKLLSPEASEGAQRGVKGEKMLDQHKTSKMFCDNAEAPEALGYVMRQQRSYHHFLTD